MCGGIVHIFIHEIRTEHQDAVLADLQATIDHTPAGLVTLLDGENAGAKLFVDGERTIGTLGQGELLDKNATREAQGAAGRPILLARLRVRTGPRSGPGCASTTRSRPSRRG